MSPRLRPRRRRLARSAKPAIECCSGRSFQNGSVSDPNLEIIHFPSGDGLGCRSSDGKYRDGGRRLADA
jgi:hypothetical protein